MVRQKFLARTLVAALCAGAAAVAAFGPAFAGDVKVPEAATIKKKLENLYNGTVAGDSIADRENVILAVEKVLKDKDKQGVALKKPDFWVDAAQEGRFAGGKRKIAPIKKLMSEDIDIPLRDDKPDTKPKKAKMWWRAGGLVTGTKPAPLLIAILDKDTDPKTYLETVWPDTIDEVGKQWIVVAMQESPEFPISKDPGVILRPFLEIRDRFNTDANRWFIDGVGAACQPVQRATMQLLANRLSGMVLRGPQAPITNANSALCPTLVVYGATSAPGKAVGEAYKKIAETNVPVEVADLPAVAALNQPVIDWVLQRPKRTVPATSTWVTTITDTDGEPWTGSMKIMSPGKRGFPTTVTVTYIRDTNSVDIKCENLGEFFIFMNDDLLDLDKDVSVWVNGEALVKKTFERNLRGMLDLADEFGEWGRMFPVGFRGVVPTKIAPQPPAPGPGDQPPAPGNPAPAPGNPAPAPGNPAPAPGNPAPAPNNPPPVPPK